MAKLNLNRRQFTEALDRYREAGVLDAAAEEALEWFWGYSAGELGMDSGRMAEALQYDGTTLWNLLAGNRTASLDSAVDRIRKLQSRSAGRVGSIIQTPVVRRIWEALDYCRNTGSMVVVRGETGRGKTFAAREWCRANNHGRSIYVRCPSGCTRNKLIREIARASGIGVSGKKGGALESQVLAAYDRKRTLVVDEAGHMVPTHGRNARDQLDLLRDLHDMCESGVCLIWTSVYWDELKTGRMAPFFEQFLGRIRYDLHIPEGKLFAEEIAPIVAAHGFPEDCVTLAAEIAREDGKLRTLFADLANARVFAESAGVPLDAKVLKQARAWRRSGGAWTETPI